MFNFAINLEEIPQNSGVYFWKDQKGSILYIGKAKNINKRINEYLEGALNSYKTKKMMSKVASLDFIVTKNEKEALLLEQELIKKHHPYYNILLLDDKKYPFIVVSLKKHKLEIATRFYYKQTKNSFYYGPLPTGYGSKVLKNFLIRECLFKDGLPIENNSISFWKEQYNYAKLILSSSNQFILKKLKHQLNWAIENEQFEIAKEIHETLTYLDKKNQVKQAIDFGNNENFDVIVFDVVQEYLLIVIHHFVNGIFNLQEEFIIEIKTGLVDETMIEFINQFYQIRNQVKKIITNQNLEQWKISTSLNLVRPQKGKYFQALNNALDNLKLNQDLKISTYKNQVEKITKAKIFLDQICNQEIKNFLMVDNSNFANNDIVSVFIYYKNFQPFHGNYRKYFLKTKLKNKSDVSYMEQGLRKYFKQDPDFFNDLDLLIVDGGVAQINTAKQVLKELNLNLRIVGLVKNNQHKTDHLLTSDKKKYYFNDLDVYNFFSKLQIEVDEFAKNYHREKRLQNSLSRTLVSIDGIGLKTETKLLNHFKTYTNIFNATEAELKKIVSEKIALKIIEKFKNGV